METTSTNTPGSSPKEKTKYDKQMNVYNNKKAYIALFGLFIILALVAIYFVWSTQSAPEVKTRIIYRSPRPAIPSGYYDAYE